MISEQSVTIGNYVAKLAARGRYSFTSAEAREALAVSKEATKQALHRLIKKGEVASPGRGFYIIVPPEYRSLQSLPADQFIPALMQHYQQPYYVGLLSAAQYHGAAHHRPQEFQVLTPSARRPTIVGAVRVTYFVRKDLVGVPTQTFNTPRGTISVSTPEATAFDLVGYQDRVGGLDVVATVLSDLAEAIDPQKLADAASSAPVPWAQRLGYLLDQVDAQATTDALKTYVENHVRDIAKLLPSSPSEAITRSADWKLDVNATVEPDL